ncbi:hypothetical protein CDD83_1524 [Cordyceps sp. RAO-2017]|nr:hypothetical protein CDD83_1524 [Cordyceps sp. RAO-2017]
MPRLNLTPTRLCMETVPATENGAVVAGHVTTATLCPGVDVAELGFLIGNSKFLDIGQAPQGMLTLPDILRQTFSSGTTKQSSISNIFDIEWRQYKRLKAENSFTNITSNLHVTGIFQNIQNLVLSQKTEVIEGLIIDINRAIVGFRNHTVPIGFDHPVIWHEDLLFVEPETVCVDTNLTIQIDIMSGSDGFMSASADLSLLDKGGLSALNLMKAPEPDFPNPQKYPDLYRRAFAAAQMYGILTVRDLNLSSLSVQSTSVTNQKKITLGEVQLYRFNPQQELGDCTLSSTFWVENINGRINNNSKIEYMRINDLCRGLHDDAKAAHHTVLIECGLLAGVPQDSSDESMNFYIPWKEGNRTWTKGLYSCASAVKASIKTVTLSVNGRAAFNLPQVTEIKDKEYPDQGRIPLWGVEDPHNRYTSGMLSLLWGLVSPESESMTNMTTYRQPFFYLPGRMDSAGREMFFMTEGENLAGADFGSNMMRAAYQTGGTRVATASFEYGIGSNYLASTNRGLWSMWHNLSRTAETASMIPNIIFTDLTASAVVGTKGASSAIRKPLVTPQVSRLRYKPVYAVPAIIAGAFILAIVLIAFAICLAERGRGLAGIRNHVQVLAPGRIYTTLLPSQSENGSDLAMHGKDWNKRFGAQVIDLSRPYPKLKSSEAENERENGERLT